MTTENLPAEAADNETPVEGAALMAAPLAETPKLDASNPIHFVVIDRLAQLEAALLARDPMMKVHLGAIHKELNQHEELVHLLSNEEIGMLLNSVVRRVKQQQLIALLNLDWMICRSWQQHMHTPSDNEHSCCHGICGSEQVLSTNSAPHSQQSGTYSEQSTSSQKNTGIETMEGVAATCVFFASCGISTKHIGAYLTAVMLAHPDLRHLVQATDKNTSTSTKQP